MDEDGEDKENVVNTSEERKQISRKRKRACTQYRSDNRKDGQVLKISDNKDVGNLLMNVWADDEDDSDIQLQESPKKKRKLKITHKAYRDNH